MTTQIKPPQQEPPQSYITQETPSPRSFFLWRLFKHPLILISVLVHGALLVTPVPPETKVEQPKIKDIPVTKTISLKRTKVKPKLKPKPKPKPKPRPPISQALLKPRPIPQPKPIPQVPPQQPEAEKPKPEQKESPKEQEPQTPDPKQKTEDDPKDKENKGSEASTAPPIESEEVENILGELDQELINTNIESEFDYIPSPSEFPEPDKFFTPDSIKAFDFVNNPNLVADGGIINSPRYYRLKDPKAVLASIPTIPAFQSASEPKQIGDYGGGPVYELKVEDKTYFINLVKAKSISKATFVVFWRWDPNNPPQP